MLFYEICGTIAFKPKTSTEKDASSLSPTVEIDEDFVMIANPDAGGTPPKPLNLNLHHTFQTVIVLAALSGEAGADASRHYLQSASTRHRAKIIIIASPPFPVSTSRTTSTAKPLSCLQMPSNEKSSKPANKVASGSPCYNESMRRTPRNIPT